MTSLILDVIPESVRPSLCPMTIIKESLSHIKSSPFTRQSRALQSIDHIGYLITGIDDTSAGWEGTKNYCYVCMVGLDDESSKGKSEVKVREEGGN